MCKCCGQCYSQNLFPHQAQHKGPYSVPISNQALYASLELLAVLRTFKASLYNSSLNAFEGPLIGASSIIHASYPQCPCLRLFGCKSQVDALQCPLFHMASSAVFMAAEIVSFCPSPVPYASVQAFPPDSVLRWSAAQSEAEGKVNATNPLLICKSFREFACLCWALFCYEIPTQSSRQLTDWLFNDATTGQVEWHHWEWNASSQGLSHLKSFPGFRRFSWTNSFTITM